MASVRMGDQGVALSKKAKNSNVTKDPCRPPSLPNTPAMIEKQHGRTRMHKRVHRHYPGWGC